MAKQITVEAGFASGKLFIGQIESSHDTIKEAKERAYYYLTKDYQRACESNDRLTVARVNVNGECVWDLDKSGPPTSCPTAGRGNPHRP